MITIGVDVSEHQPPALVPWKALVAQGVRFMAARAGFGLGPDPTFREHVSRALDAGVELVMAYQVGRPIRSILGQVELLAEACEVGAEPVMDFEVLDDCPAQQVSDLTLEYVETAERLIGSCILYTYPFFAAALPLAPELARFPLWIAHYPKAGGTLARPTIPRPWTDWTIWQHDGDGGQRAPNGLDLDFNRFRGTVDELRAALAPKVKPIERWTAPDAVLGTVARLAAQASGHGAGGAEDFRSFDEGPVIGALPACGNCGEPAGCGCVARHRPNPATEAWA